MSEENKDQVLEDIVKDDETSKKQSEEGEETKELTPQEMTSLVKGLQKGYTISRQELSELKGMISELKESKKGEDDQDEYLTKKSFLELMDTIKQKEIEQKEEVGSVIDSALSDLHATGVLTSKADEDDLMAYAVKTKEPDLFKAAVHWQEIKALKGNVSSKKDDEDVKTKQKEGSKVGSSQKSNSSSGVDYNKIHNTRWGDIE